MSRANEFAFPAVGLELSNGEVRLPVAHQGLTIREHFAAMAMQGLLANASTCTQEVGTIGEIVHSAVRHADALITELAKVKP